MTEKIKNEIVRLGNMSLPALRNEWCVQTLDTSTKKDVMDATRGKTRGDLLADLVEDLLEQNG